VSEPINFKKVVAVNFNNKSNFYTGLPTHWRELLEMPLDASRSELDMSILDKSMRLDDYQQKKWF
jgi:hypothetical protein